MSTSSTNSRISGSTSISLPVCLLHSHLGHVTLELLRSSPEINLLQLRPPDAATRAAMLHNKAVETNTQSKEKPSRRERRQKHQELRAAVPSTLVLCVIGGDCRGNQLTGDAAAADAVTRWKTFLSESHATPKPPESSRLWLQVQQSRLLDIRCALTMHSVVTDTQTRDEREAEWWWESHLFVIPPPPLRLLVTQQPKSTQDLQDVVGKSTGASQVG